jgi:hypothetical protein
MCNTKLRDSNHSARAILSATCGYTFWPFVFFFFFIIMSTLIESLV